MSPIIWYGVRGKCEKYTAIDVLMTLPEWWQERICICTEIDAELTALHVSRHKGVWHDPTLTEFPPPPECNTCGKWYKNHLHKCSGCGDIFYQLFRHPRMGGFGPTFCWDCCQTSRSGTNEQSPYWSQMPNARPHPSAIPPRASASDLLSAADDALSDLFDSM